MGGWVFQGQSRTTRETQHGTGVVAWGKARMLACRARLGEREE